MTQKKFLLLLCLLVLVLLAHGGVIFNDYVMYDDHLYISDNAYVRNGLSLESMYWAFSNFEDANWIPLTWLSHMAVVEFGNLDPIWHHFVNLLLHTANVLLLFGLLCSMTGAPIRAFAVAAFFAVHPLHVESVAWIAERKDVLSMFFGLLTLQAYVLYTKKGGIGWYVAALALLLSGLMSKPLLVSLPLLMLLLDYWPLDRIHLSTPGCFFRENKRLFWEKLPFFLMVFGSCILTMVAQHVEGAMANLENYDPSMRLANVLSSYVLYLWKLVVPLGLAPIYPLKLNLPLWKPIGALVVLGGISTGVLILKRRARYLIVGWFWYLVAMLPMIGIVQVGSQSMADRYAYLPFIGVYVALVWGAGDLLQKITDVSRRNFAAIILLIVPLFCLTLLTRHQVILWRNTFILFQHSASVMEDNFIARKILAKAYTKVGLYNKAMEQYGIVLDDHPGKAINHWHVIKMHITMGEYDAAAKAMALALEKFPEDSELRNLNGFLLYKMGRVREALKEFAYTLELDPKNTEARQNWQNMTNLLKMQNAKRDKP